MLKFPIVSKSSLPTRHPAKTVGHAHPRTAAERLEWNRRTLRLSPRYGRWCERGVRRFRTWEEAGSFS